MKSNKQKTSGINIHINASCHYFTINEIIPEEKAVKRLEDIRDSFKWYNEKSGMKINTNLIVKTGVHNPKLF